MRRPELLLPYLGVTVVHLAAQWLGAEAVAAVTQVLLMPALAAYLLLATGPDRPRLVRLVLFALAFSWLGDTVPRFLDGDPAFLAMVGCFLVAQVVFIVAFRPFARDGLLGARRALLAPYLLVWAALLAACLPEAGALAPAVLVYGGCLLAMAVLATGVHQLVWAGGAVFMASDGMIALGAFADWWDVPQHDVAVMLTYTAAQLLIVLGVLAQTRPQAGGAAAHHPAVVPHQ